MTEARDAKHIPTLISAGFQTRFARLICGNFFALEIEGKEIYDAIFHIGLYLYFYEHVVPGLRLAIEGDPKVAAETLGRGLAEYNASGQSCHNSLLKSYLAYAYLRAGDIRGARACIHEAGLFNALY